MYMFISQLYIFNRILVSMNLSRRLRDITERGIPLPIL